MLWFKCRVRWGATMSVLLLAVAGTDAQAATKEAEVAARVDDAVITVQEVDSKVLSTNMKLAQQMYDARLQALNQLVMEKALSKEAASKNMSVDALIGQKLAAQAKPVTDAQVQAYFDKNKGRLRGKTFDQVAGQIRSYLASQATTRARQRLVSQVKKNAKVRIMLEAPRVEVAVADNDPYKGPRDAKVTIVEFSDFQ